jgi:hypothetical protein
MEMTGSEGILSVPAEHLPGFVWLVAAPLVASATVYVVQLLANHGHRTSMRLARHWNAMPLAARVALFAALIGAGVHAAIVSTHWTEDRTRAWLFVADTAAFVIAMVWALRLRSGWRPANLLVLGGTTATYVFYLLQGWEELDLVGLITTTVELAAALVLLGPVRAEEGRARGRQRLVALVALPVALVSLLGTGAVASGINDGVVDHHHHAPSEDMHHMPGMHMHMPGMHSEH